MQDSRQCDEETDVLLSKPLGDGSKETEDIVLGLGKALEEDITLHSDIVQTCLTIVNYIALIGFFETFCSKSRSAVWILYARHFESSTFMISVWKCIGVELNGIFGLLQSLLSEKIGYDSVLLLIMISTIIGTLLESAATDFTMMLIGFCLTQSPINAICVQFSLYTMPLHYSTQINVRYNIYCMCAVLGAPIFSGIIVYAADSYRVIFIINCVVVVIFTLYVYKFVFGVENKVINLQLNQLTDVYTRNPIIPFTSFASITEQANLDNYSDLMFLSSKDYRFPKVMHHIMNNNDNESNNNNNNGDNYGDYSRYDWFIFWAFSLYVSFVNCLDLIASVWFTVYATDVLDWDILVSTSFISYLSVFLIVGALSYQAIVKKYKLNDRNNKIYNFQNHYVQLLLITPLGMAISSFLLQLLNTTFNVDSKSTLCFAVYLILFTIAGICVSVSAVSGIIVKTSMQPLNKLGYANGISLFISWSMRACCIITIGILWGADKQWYWYSQIIISLSMFAIILIVATSETCNLRKYFE